VSAKTPALLVVEAGDELQATELASFEAAGLVVARVKLAALGDRPAMAELGAALAELRERDDVDEESVAVLGIEHGATVALLHACMNSGLAGLVMWGGVFLRDKLDAERPFQPLEMALGLEAPLLAHLGADAAAGSTERVQLTREALSQFARGFDIVAHSDVGARFEGAPRAKVLQHSLDFLVELFELRQT
jgi:dienelactone hydrolase